MCLNVTYCTKPVKHKKAEHFILKYQKMFSLFDQDTYCILHFFA